MTRTRGGNLARWRGAERAGCGLVRVRQPDSSDDRAPAHRPGCWSQQQPEQMSIRDSRFRSRDHPDLSSWRWFWIRCGFGSFLQSTVSSSPLGVVQWRPSPVPLALPLSWWWPVPLSLQDFLVARLGFGLFPTQLSHRGFEDGPPAHCRPSSPSAPVASIFPRIARTASIMSQQVGSDLRRQIPFHRLGGGRAETLRCG